MAEPVHRAEAASYRRCADADGDLPVTIIRNRWFVPESFIDLVFVSMRPGRAADFSEVAQAWFTANADPEAVA